MHKTVTIKSMLTAVVAGASLAMTAAPAFALSVPAVVGAPASSADAACLIRPATGAVINNCGRQVAFIMPMAVNQGSHTVSLSTNNPGGGAFNCVLVAMSQAGAATTGTSVFPDVGTRSSSLTVTVPANGSMTMFCNFNPGGTIFNINYNQ